MYLRQLGDTDEIREMCVKYVPWSISPGYVNFQVVPKTSKKGIIHISFLAWDGEAYHGKGMYVTDAIMLLETLAPAALMAKVLEVKPRAGAKLSAFGWCTAGNIANRAISCAMTS